jgi:hypothetical protein
MRKIEEKYHKMTDDHSDFDIEFWQSQGAEAIFKAAEDMIKDYFIIRGKDVSKLRLQRSVEAFRKA